MISKQIRSLNDLREYGIDALTGEADALGMRILCDITEQGAQIIADVFGMTFSNTKINNPEDYNCESPTQPIFKLNSNWNSSQGSIASIFLPSWDAELYKQLGVHALARAGYEFIVITKDSVRGTDDQEVIENIKKFEDGCRVIKNWRHVDNKYQCGDRNVHQFSGRVS